MHLVVLCGRSCRNSCSLIKNSEEIAPTAPVIRRWKIISLLNKLSLWNIVWWRCWGAKTFWMRRVSNICNTWLCSHPPLDVYRFNECEMWYSHYDILITCVKSILRIMQFMLIVTSSELSTEQRLLQYSQYHHFYTVRSSYHISKVLVSGNTLDWHRYNTQCRVKINPLNTKRRLLYLKIQFVPRSKHFSSRL